LCQRNTDTKKSYVLHRQVSALLVSYRVNETAIWSATRSYLVALGICERLQCSRAFTSRTPANLWWLRVRSWVLPNLEVNWTRQKTIGGNRRNLGI